MEHATCGARRRLGSERGQTLIEAAITIPLLLLIAVAILEFGRAYETSQILTNAAREGARLAVVPSPDLADVSTRVREYMKAGKLTLAEDKAVEVIVDRNASYTVNGRAVSATQVTINYPFDFIVLKPVAQLVTKSTTLGNRLNLQASALMRNEQ